MATEMPALEATIAKLTARAPDKLYVLDRKRNERFEAELARRLALLEGDDADDVDSYLDEVLNGDDGEEIVATDAYPRNAGMASGIYQALKALRLSSRATVYFEVGECNPEGILALARSAMDDEAGSAFGRVIALPTYFHAGDDLLEIDRHLSVCTSGSWFYDELLDHEAEWMEQEKLDEGEERRAELQRAIDESREEGDADADQLDHAQETLDATPPWFLLLTETELEQVAHYTLPEPSHTPRLRHRYRPWTRPTHEMFLRPGEATNRQHIIAAYLLAR